MRHAGNKSSYGEERDRELLHAYHTELARSTSKVIRTKSILGAVLGYQTSRFFVSADRAYRVILKMDLGDDLRRMSPTAREMFCEIYKRYLVLKAKRKDLSRVDIVRMVIRMPAPKFYLTPKSAMVILSRANKRWKEICKRRLKLLSSHL